MTNSPNIIEIAAFALVMLCCFGFAAAFIFQTKPPVTEDRKHDRSSIAGIVLQGISFAIVWSIRRPYFTPFAGHSAAIEILLSAFAVGIAAGSVWLALAAVRVLGKEWSLTARVIEGHKLATDGPYSFTRNPIYTGMLGMLIAVALVLSNWVALTVALVLFLIGTFVRIKTEERLLAEAFGADYQAYKSRVPVLIPGVF